MDVGTWLRGLGLNQYEQAFRDNDIDIDLLTKLTAEDLKELGVASVGHRRRLLDAIAAQRPDIVLPADGSAEASGPAVGAERRQLTVMFIDLVGSTALAARLDPEEMQELIRAYQNTVAAEIGRFEGHLAKFMGDGVLAYLGWPRAHEDDAERAVRAGIAAVRAVARLQAPGGEPLAARAGIATGLVVVGDLIGDEEARERAVTGGTPNLAARLQALAPPGGVVVADATRQLLGSLFELEDLGLQSVKGLDAPVHAFRVGAERGGVGRFEARQAGSRLAPLVGRDQELALLLERWRLARGGEGQLVLLTGEAGIGKSRITRALMDVATAAGEAPLRVQLQCSPYHTDSALHPAVQQLAHAAGFTAGDTVEQRLDKLEALVVPAGGSVADVAPPVRRPCAHA
jgi:class 3 adenylate cyclase